jgi:UPF0042 nucleotide-binding protein
MRLLILSGLSGAGKSVALHMLEDLGYYCIDNLPAALLKAFISHTVRSSEKVYERTAIGLDARNTDAEIALVPTLVDELSAAASTARFCSRWPATRSCCAASPRRAAPTP